MGNDIAEVAAEIIPIFDFFRRNDNFNSLYLHQYLSNGDEPKLEFILSLSSIE